MLKPTKRKAFKFYRSYFDMFNELEKDADKIKFINAILEKQFLGKDPELNGIVKLAYLSQLHSIEKQVKGFEDATGIRLSDPLIDPLQGCLMPPLVHPPQEEQEEEKEEEKEKGALDVDYGALLIAFNSLTGKKSRVINNKTKAQIKARFKEGYNKADIWKALQNAVNDPFHKETNLRHITLEFITRADKLDKFISLAEPSTKYNPNL